MASKISRESVTCAPPPLSYLLMEIFCLVHRVANHSIETSMFNDLWIPNC